MPADEASGRTLDTKAERRATAGAADGLFVFAEVAQQVGPPEFVVERCGAQRAIEHDLEEIHQEGRERVAVAAVAGGTAPGPGGMPGARRA